MEVGIIPSNLCRFSWGMCQWQSQAEGLLEGEAHVKLLSNWFLEGRE